MKKNVTLEWDYQQPIKGKNIFYGVQKDWNQTIVTKLNQLHAHHRPFDGGYPIKILSPSRFKEIFDSLYFYDKKTSLIAEKYLIEYIESDVDYLLFNNQSKITIKNFK